MKQIYFFVVAMLASLGMVSTAQAEELFSFTVEWNNPGSVTLKKGWGAVSLAPDATSFTYESDNEWAANLVVGAATGWQIDEVYYTDGGEKVAVNKGYAGYSLSMSTYNGKTIKVVTSKVVMDSKVTIDLLYTPKAISEVSFAGSGVTQTTFVKGEQQIEFSSALDSEVTIVATADAWTLDSDGDKAFRRFYSIKKNGVDASEYWNDWKTLYSIPVADGDVITIQPTEVDPNAGVNPEDLVSKVNFDFSGAPAGLLKNVFCNSKFYYLADLAEGLTVDKGTEVRVNFNEDYVIESVTYAGKALDVINGSVKFKADESGTFVVTAKDKEYGKKTFTAYVVCPEGLRLANGNLLSGEDADLTGGEAYNQEIVVPAVGDGVKEFTIPAGTAKKVEFELSDKFDSMSLVAKEGYWLKAVRDFAALNTPLETMIGKQDAPVMLLVAKKVEHDATATVYIDKSMDATKVQLRPDRSLGASQNRTFTQSGFNTFTFDSEFEPAFSVVSTDGDMVDWTGENPKPNFLATIYEDATWPVVGDDMSWDSENVCYMAAVIPDGGLVKVYNQIRKTVKVTRDRFAFGEAMVMGTWENIDLTEPETTASLRAYPLTDINFFIDPMTTEVWVDGVKQEGDGEGGVTVTVEGNHKIEVKLVSGDPSAAVFSPAPGEVSKLDEILISFPNASYAEVTYGKTADEIRFSCGDIWAPIGAEIEQVEDAEVPTFRYTLTPAPTQAYTYTMMIPADFFKFNFTEDEAAADLTASFTLKPEVGEITYAFEPSAALNAEWNGWGAWVGVVFNEDVLVRGVKKDLIKVEWNGEEVDAADWSYGTEYNTFMVCVNHPEVLACNEGTIRLIMEAGALTFNGLDIESPAIDHSWAVRQPQEFVYDIPGFNYDEENGMFTVFVAFPGTYETVDVYNENGITLKESGYGSGNYWETGHIMKSEAAVADFDDLMQEGEAPAHLFGVMFPLPKKNTTYTFSSRQGTFTINGFQESESFEKDFQYSEIATGIASVMMDMLSEGKVYNLQGIAQSKKLSELPAGVYIVNGAKVVKR